MDYIIYGVVGLGVEKCYKFCQEKGRVIAFTDGDKEKWGGEFYGLKCISPDELKTRNAIIVNRVTIECDIVKRFLEKIGVPSVTFAELFYNDDDNKNRLEETRLLLADEMSRKTLDIVIDAKINADKSRIREISLPIKDQYTEFFPPKAKQFFVDAGAFVGDSIEPFLFHNNGCSKYYAFEPFEKPYNGLVARTERIEREYGFDKGKITCVNMALGASSETLGIVDDGDIIPGASRFAGQGNYMQTTLDEYLDGKCVDFIKADIEGMETEMLMGAKETIKKWRPCLAICVYHYFEDIFNIPLYIHSLVPEYKIFMRHHGNSIAETVMYAMID